MRWPWSGKHHETQPVSTDVGEATQARAKAEQALAHAEEQTGEILEVAATSRQHRRVNHFAQLISETFRGTS